MTDERSALKFSAAMMVFGLGDTILPHFPPPIMAISSTDGDSPRRFPMDKAMGATVITATSIKTPTVHSNIAARAKAANTRFSPSVLMMALEIVVAAPVLISMPDSTPAVRMRIMAGVTSLTPSVITLTVSASDSPPNNPPTIAPAIRL